MESKTFKLNWYSFLISFAIGITYVYFVVPPPKLVFKYPTPYNAGKVIYESQEGDSCYKYNVQEVQCTKDAIKQPVNN